MSKETGNGIANGVLEKTLEGGALVCSGEKGLVHEASLVVWSTKYFLQKYIT